VRSPGDEVALALALAARLASPLADLSTQTWGDLCVTDLDALLLRIRQMVFGDSIRAEAICPAPPCGSRIDVTFGVDAFLASHSTRRARDVEDADDTGWFRLRGANVTFRLPTASDLVAILDCPAPEGELTRRCIQPAGLPAAQRRRVETVMAAMAPNLSGEVQGTCPECGAMVPMWFDVRRFCLGELRGQAAFVFEDIHALAATYHWPLAEILALPWERRSRLAGLVLREGRSA
jgi:hypothetical protein